MIAKVVSYVIQVRWLQKKHKYSHSNINAMDETLVWCDMVAETTIDAVGKKKHYAEDDGSWKA